MVSTPSEPVNSGAVLLPSRPYLLQNLADPQQVHPMYPPLHLGVFVVSSNVMRQRYFLKMLPTYSSHRASTSKTYCTNLFGGVGAAGVLIRKVNPLSVLLGRLL